MNKNGRAKGGLADPSRLQSMDRDDGDIVQVVIETPKGSRNKYAFDPEQKVFELKRVGDTSGGAQILSIEENTVTLLYYGRNVTLTTEKRKQG